MVLAGTIADVAGTLYDLRQSTRLGDVIDNVVVGNDGVAGFDNNFVITGPTGKKLAARL